MTKERSWAGLFCGKASSRTAIFGKEIESNLERVYVMEQRSIVSRKLDLTLPVPYGFESYAQCVKAFNTAFDDHQTFKAIYDASLEHKNHANAVILEKKHEIMLEKFNLLKSVILTALKRPDSTEA